MGLIEAALAAQSVQCSRPTNMAREMTGKEYVAAPFEHPNISVRKALANLVRRKGAKDKFHSDLEPAQLGQISRRLALNRQY